MLVRSDNGLARGASRPNLLSLHQGAGFWGGWAGEETWRRVTKQCAFISDEGTLTTILPSARRRPREGQDGLPLTSQHLPGPNECKQRHLGGDLALGWALRGLHCVERDCIDASGVVQHFGTGRGAPSGHICSLWPLEGHPRGSTGTFSSRRAPRSPVGAWLSPNGTLRAQAPLGARWQ